MMESDIWHSLEPNCTPRALLSSMYMTDWQDKPAGPNQCYKSVSILCVFQSWTCSNKIFWDFVYFLTSPDVAATSSPGLLAERFDGLAEQVLNFRVRDALLRRELGSTFPTGVKPQFHGSVSRGRFFKTLSWGVALSSKLTCLRKM
jgi:hypothetical protein